MKAIEVKNISKKYGSNYVLKGVSFEVESKTIHGFVGPNGAGKTTVESIITRLVFPNSGEVKVDGKSIANDPTFNKDLGFIPAESRFPNLKVRDYLLEVGHFRDIPAGTVLQKLANSPLSRFSGMNCSQLSTGWKKVLQLFAVSLYRPKIIIADEPFNGLDIETKEELLDNFKRIKERGGTILISMHDILLLQELLADGDGITMIKKGTIVYTGLRTADIRETYRKHFIDKNRKGMFDL